MGEFLCKNEVSEDDTGTMGQDKHNDLEVTRVDTHRGREMGRSFQRRKELVICFRRKRQWNVPREREEIDLETDGQMDHRGRAGSAKDEETDQRVTSQ